LNFKLRYIITKSLKVKYTIKFKTTNFKLMKKITFLSLFIVLLISVRTIAQPTLTAATSNPVAGNVFLQHQIGYDDPGVIGANITWDFSGVFEISTVTNTFSLPSATPYASLYPSANLASTINSGGTIYYSYFNTSTSSYTLNGMNIPSMATSMPYTDPEKLLSYPFTYNSTYTDAFATTVSGYDRHGSVTVLADAYGTIILPYGTITNVLRVKATETYADYISGSAVTNYTSTNYYWYKPGIKYCVFQLSQLKMNGNLYQQYGLYLDETHVGISDNVLTQNTINCYPNPATDIITLEVLQNSTSNDNNFTLSDLNGKELIKQELNQLSNKTEIDISSLSGGIYFLKLVYNDKVEIKKIVKK